MEGFSKNNIEIKNQNEIELSNSSVSGQSESDKKEIRIENSKEKENLVNFKRNEILEIFDDKKENDTENKEKVKEGVDFVFEQNPKLGEIGTKEQYSEYLDTIFTESKMRNIVYHGSHKSNIDSFLPGKLDIGIHFGTLDAAKYRGEKSEQYKIYPVLINILKTKEFPDLSVFNEHNIFNYLLEQKIVNEEDREYLNGLYKKDPINNHRDNGGDAMFEYLQNKIGGDSLQYKNNFEDKGSTSYIVFNPEQIQILGCEQDIENFKKFIENHEDSQS
jgi:hypothetical protein